MLFKFLQSWFLFLVVLSSTSPLFSQSTPAVSDTSNDNSEKVLMIIVQGNDKTKEEIIKREMKLQPKVRFDWNELERDRLRIMNLGIFNRVEIDMVPTKNGSILIVTVSEMWYIYPYPIIFRNERDWGRISVGAGLLHTNFRGRREIIDFSFWLGFNPSIRLRYSNPWIFGKAKLYTTVSVFAKKVRNQTFTALDSSVNENRIGIDWRLGKRFGHFTYFDVTLGYKQLSFPSQITGATLSASGKDKLPSLGFSFRFDNRDLWEYAHKGNYVALWATKTGFSGDVNYLRYGADLRKYFPIGKTTLALRTATNLSSGTIPIYDNVHFGFLTRIRGHFNDQFSGENMLLGSAEYRFPIRKITYHNWGPFQSMGQFGTNLRFGISGALFADTGSLWNDYADFSTDNFITGWGGGLHFFLPYQMLLRFEYAFRNNWDGQFIIDALVSF